MPDPKLDDIDLQMRLRLLEGTVEAAKAEFGSQNEIVADALDASAELRSKASAKRHEAIAARLATELRCNDNDVGSAKVAYAGFWLRFAARAIDCIVIGSIASGAVIIAGTYDKVSYGFPFMSVAIVEWLYYTGFESSHLQASPGKLMLGLKVSTKDGKRMGFARALLRSFAKLPSTVPIFYAALMMAGWTRRKQALHDMFFDTVVVRNRQPAYQVPPPPESPSPPTSVPAP